MNTHHDTRVRHAGDDVELGLEHERKVAEEPAEQVDGHEQDGDPDDLAEFVNLIILRAARRLVSHSWNIVRLTPARNLQ